MESVSAKKGSLRSGQIPARRSLHQHFIGRAQPIGRPNQVQGQSLNEFISDIDSSHYAIHGKANPFCGDGESVHGTDLSRSGLIHQIWPNTRPARSLILPNFGEEAGDWELLKSRFRCGMASVAHDRHHETSLELA